MTVNSKTQTDQFFNLDPHLILQCTDLNGYKPTGEIHQLNSYENRVFEIKLEENKSVIAKFFRPGRWSKETIQDEHEFCFDLHADGLSVGLPLKAKNQETVFDANGILYCFYEKVRGRMMQEVLLNQFEKLGSLTAQLHNTGEKKEALHRNFFGPSQDNKWFLLDQLDTVIAPEIHHQYIDLAEHVFETLDNKLDPQGFIRIHDDLHRGNLLDNGQNDITIVDFDDFINGPVVQDFWMIFPDQEFTPTKEFELFLKGYETLRKFDDRQLELVPYLRAYRVICYAGWILNRWNDPSFPKIFPEFNTYRYWAEEFDSLRKIIKD